MSGLLAVIAAASGNRGPIAFWSAAVTQSIVGVGTARATITINTDGTTSTQIAGASAVAGPNWYEPTTPGIGNDFSVTATATGSPLNTGTLGSALALTSARSWMIEVTTTEFKETFLSFDMQRSGSSQGTGSVSLLVEKEP